MVHEPESAGCAESLDGIIDFGKNRSAFGGIGLGEGTKVLALGSIFSLEGETIPSEVQGSRKEMGVRRGDPHFAEHIVAGLVEAFVTVHITSLQIQNNAVPFEYVSE